LPLKRSTNIVKNVVMLHRNPAAPDVVKAENRGYAIFGGTTLPRWKCGR
jgi:hypothetical protein